MNNFYLENIFGFIWRLITGNNEEAASETISEAASPAEETEKIEETTEETVKTAEDQTEAAAYDEASQTDTLPENNRRETSESSAFYMQDSHQDENRENSPEYAEETTEEITEEITDEGFAADENGAVSETEITTETAADVPNIQGKPQGGSAINIIILVCAAAAVIIAFLAVLKLRYDNSKKEQSLKRDEPIKPVKDSGSEKNMNGRTVKNGDNFKVTIGKIHNIGRRKSQQDSFGTMPLGSRLLAVVADGMGGLSDGDMVSQKIVMTMFDEKAVSSADFKENPLFKMLAKTNREVNNMLGSSKLYKCGSTAVTVIADKNCFHWASVGDSRIYLFRNDGLIQLNTEHNYETELILKAINGETGFGGIKSNPDRNKLTSFIGMGELKYVDGSIRPIRIQKGDRILLMSDGVFNTLSEEEMTEVLKKHSHPDDAAGNMLARILECGAAKQDNFTAVILGFD